MRYEFQIDKECKHSRRYSALEPKCPIKKVYVDRSYANGKDVIILEFDDLSKTSSSQ